MRSLGRNLADVADPRDAVNDTFESFAEDAKRLVIVGDFFEIPMEQQLTRSKWDDVLYVSEICVVYVMVCAWCVDVVC